MGDRLQMLKDMGINLYGLGENVASLGSAAIAEPVAGFAAMYDPFNRDSSNLLAQSAKLAPTAGISAYLYNQQNKDKQ